MRWNGRRAQRMTRIVTATYGLRCHICLQEIDPALRRPHPQSLSIDHLVPQSRGGSNALENLRPAHLGCNSARGARQLRHTAVDNRSFFRLSRPDTPRLPHSFPPEPYKKPRN